MSDHLHDYRCLLEGVITLDSTIPHNTSGGFGDVFTATHPMVGKLALKRPRGDQKRLVAVTGVWASLKHPRILQFLGIHKIDNNVYLVSAFAENGSLPGFLERRPDVDRRRLVIEIAEGLAYLHQCCIIHGDLKGNNVLICGEEHVRLCDFGLAKHVTSRTLTTLRGVGSLLWQSPELLQDASRRTLSSDVYAFGITVYEVLSGKEPYTHHVGIGPILTGVLTGERPPKEPQVAPDGSSYLEFWDEASKCWAADSSLRPRIIDVLNRLDRRRAETLVTSQHRVLENSFIPPIGGTPM
ncbi:hypothetical protein M407DRAFT_235549 [Tulasnella calospora MUT 4182]|uniref:Protein kinase domain-containing protein n=1 Tax=Tulasnella calospora MUT 4182 TaxID=1051891 RepID=A0A0C3KXZ9_9AGAM|nr:hypothetical protein M407DRAFT_235549 [Tulasnella calospora MUT 4182]